MLKVQLGSALMNCAQNTKLEYALFINGPIGQQ